MQIFEDTNIEKKNFISCCASEKTILHFKTLNSEVMPKVNIV